MTILFRVARLELAILFYSIIGWLVLLVFTVQCGITIGDMLYSKESSQQLGSELGPLTAELFAGSYGFFASVLRNLYLYIPLLTMGVMSRELSSGTIKLLQSSPVTNAQVVCGKYLALLYYGLCFVAVLMGVGITAGMAVEHLDFGHIAVALLGTYLLWCAYAAIGLFMSSLTKYQVVAAVSTLAILAGLNYVGKVGQNTLWIREFTYWLSLAGRTNHFVSGMVSSADLFYFLLVIFLFISLTIMHMDDGRVLRSDVVRSFRYAGLVALVLLLGYATSLPRMSKYADFTRFETNTLTEASRRIIKRLGDKPVSIASYANILHPHGRLGTLKWRKFDQKQFEQYTRFMPGMAMPYTLYYDYVPDYGMDSTENLQEKAYKSALAHEVDIATVLAPEEIGKIIDLKPEQNSFVRMVHYKGDSIPLRMFQDMYVYPHEAEITAVLKRFLQKASVVAFISGHGERSIAKTGDRAYSKMTTEITSREALVNQGFVVRDIRAEQLDALDRELAIAVVADPYEAYAPREIAALQTYLAAGGNCLLMAEPGKQEIMNSLLAKIPAKFDREQVYEWSKDYSLDLIQAKFTAQAGVFELPQKPDAIVCLNGAVPIVLDEDMGDFASVNLLVSNGMMAWKSDKKVELRNDGKMQKEEPTGSWPLAVALTRQVNSRQQRIALIGDADFMSNAEFARYGPMTENITFATKLFKWFAYGEFPVDVSRPQPTDKRIKASRANIETMKYVWVGLLPALMALAGGYTLITRRRK
ncbi:Gldg family protein [Olivibacter sitiensis]|uniref:Gldg family protein n=1 Tax=Olivibacter sitiensis TaxID=376470 RepID=UPI0003F54720|nr:Gldg family protein [Olivibacter sitiensis]